jgi:hypothetical protein
MFNNTDTVINDPLRFKMKLAIGEDAYTSLRLKSKAAEAWDTLGAAGTAAAVAKSSFVASTFFAPSGLLALVGFGTAITPIGWVVAAAVASGGAFAGVSRYVKAQSKDKVTVIPNFINTPMDVLALALIDLMAPLALKVACTDGVVDNAEREFICSYFINEWGYSEQFITDAVSLAENNLLQFTVEGLALSLAEFQKENPDCNYKEMTYEIIAFLNGVMESDGEVAKKEELAIQKIEGIFKETGTIRLLKPVKEKVNKGSGYIKSIISSRVSSNKKK